MRIMIINGPNINFLGIRETGIYGTKNYDALVKAIQDKAAELNVSAIVYQSNSEGAIIDKIQEAYDNEVDALIINPGALTHYSYAIADALASIEGILKFEVHMSNIHKREEFRTKSVTARQCDGQICGFGFNGYLYAMEQAVALSNIEE